jgi:hypothetical protein
MMLYYEKMRRTRQVLEIHSFVSVVIIIIIIFISYEIIIIREMDRREVPALVLTCMLFETEKKLIVCSPNNFVRLQIRSVTADTCVLEVRQSSRNDEDDLALKVCS